MLHLPGAGSLDHAAVDGLHQTVIVAVGANLALVCVGLGQYTGNTQKHHVSEKGAHQNGRHETGPGVRVRSGVPTQQRKENVPGQLGSRTLHLEHGIHTERCGGRPAAAPQDDARGT